MYVFSISKTLLAFCFNSLNHSPLSQRIAWIFLCCILFLLSCFGKKNLKFIWFLFVAVLKKSVIDKLRSCHKKCCRILELTIEFFFKLLLLECYGLKNNLKPGFMFQFTESTRKQGFQSICCCLNLASKTCNRQVKPEHLEKSNTGHFLWFLKFV